VSQAHELAETIPGARLVVLPGDDHNPWIADYNAILEETTEFLTGRREQAHADRVLTTLLFTDIVSSTEQAAAHADTRWRDLLSAHNDAVRRAVAEHGGVEVNTTGDGFLARFERPGRAVECGQALRDLVRPLGIELRAGVHTGEVEVIDDDVAGIAVHLAARICATAAPGEILVSRTVRDLVTGAGFTFADRGEHALKGVTDPWRLYALGADHTPVAKMGAAADHMGVTDRAMVRIAKQAPRASRFFARLAGVK
jgi:class 3 adenylate cyclase